MMVAAVVHICCGSRGWSNSHDPVEFMLVHACTLLSTGTSPSFLSFSVWGRCLRCQQGE